MKWRTGAGIAMSFVIVGADAQAEPPIVLVWDAPSDTSMAAAAIQVQAKQIDALEREVQSLREAVSRCR